MLMQFLWKYVEAMVGKGIEMQVLAEMFFYVALYLIPTTLPLAILLASLMTFGNLGEHFELLAMKAAGISLLRIMRPIMVFLIFVVAASFFFQNNIVPATQARMWTMLSSIKNQKPELNIPEGSFYKELTGYNVYVRHKDKTGGMMRDMMIYNFTGGFESVSVFLADSGKIKMSQDKLAYILTLYSGETFENYLEKGRNLSPNEKIPYRRETFSKKEVLIKFDSNFNMGDESFFQSREISRGMNQLVTFLDSIKIVSDSINLLTKGEFKKRIYANTFQENPEGYSMPNISLDKTQDTLKITNWDKHFKSKSISSQRDLMERSKSRIESFKGAYSMDGFQQSDRLIRIRQHETEIHKRFALAVACILFFFIGAPLGAIVRKGGLGVPAVLSVFLFVSYYTIDMFGLKMVRQDIWPVWQGMWLSTLFLFIPGAFLTYKAVNDSVMMNPDAWKDFFIRFFGRREVRNYQRKEVIMTPPDYEKDILKIQELTQKCTLYLESHKHLTYSSLWKNGFKDNDLQDIVDQEEAIIDDLRNSSENLILGKLMDYPIIKRGYPEFLDKAPVRMACAILLPIGLAIYLISNYKRKQFKQDIRTIIKVNNDLTKELCSN